jgi:hypothetical protein
VVNRGQLVYDGCLALLQAYEEEVHAVGAQQGKTELCGIIAIACCAPKNGMVARSLNLFCL